MVPVHGTCSLRIGEGDKGSAVARRWARCGRSALTRFANQVGGLGSSKKTASSRGGPADQAERRGTTDSELGVCARVWVVGGDGGGAFKFGDGASGYGVHPVRLDRTDQTSRLPAARGTCHDAGGGQPRSLKLHRSVQGQGVFSQPEAKGCNGAREARRQQFDCVTT